MLSTGSGSIPIRQLLMNCECRLSRIAWWCGIRRGRRVMQARRSELWRIISHRRTMKSNLWKINSLYNNPMVPLCKDQQTNWRRRIAFYCRKKSRTRRGRWCRCAKSWRCATKRRRSTGTSSGKRRMTALTKVIN